MKFPTNCILAPIFLGTQGHIDAAGITFEHWQKPPLGDAVIDQCEWDFTGWSDGAVDVIQYFTSPNSESVSGIGFGIITPSETTEMSVSLYTVDDQGLLGDSSLAMTNLTTEYFQSFGVEEEPVWGYSLFSELPGLIEGDLYALRFESPSANLLRSDTNPLVGGFIEGSPSADLSFRIFTIPEPSSIGFLLSAILWTSTRRTRRCWTITSSS